MNDDARLAPSRTYLAGGLAGARRAAFTRRLSALVAAGLVDRVGTGYVISPDGRTYLERHRPNAQADRRTA